MCRGNACHFSGTLRSVKRCLRPVRALWTHQLRTVHAMREQNDRNRHAMERLLYAYFPLSLRTPRIAPDDFALREFVVAALQRTTPCQGKKRPQYPWHNFDKFRHSFVIFGTSHSDTSAY